MWQTIIHTIFILSAIVLNLIILAVNSGFVNQSRGDDTYLFLSQGLEPELGI